MLNSIPTLLIVDDDPDLLSMLKELLEEHKYRVLSAGDGIEALEVLAEHAVDCVISDVRMPRMTGVQLLAAMRSRGFHGVPLILASGFSDVTRQSAIALGAIDLLSKPYNFDSLLDLVSGLGRRPKSLPG